VVARLRIGEEKIKLGHNAGKYAVFIVIGDIFFHNCKSGEGKRRHRHLSDNIKHGYVLLDNLGGERLESLRTLAFGNWIEALRKQNLDHDIPWGERIIFPANCDIMADHRRQVILNDSIPEEIRERDFISYLAWHIYRVVNELHIADELTRYLPFNYTQALPLLKYKIPTGQWPCLKETKPIHLYVDGVVVLFGGMAVDGTDKVQYKTRSSQKKDSVIHQGAHTDFSNEKWTLCKQNPL
jgi:hypothetical protein